MAEYQRRKSFSSTMREKNTTVEDSHIMKTSSTSGWGLSHFEMRLEIFFFFFSPQQVGGGRIGKWGMWSDNFDVGHSKNAKFVQDLNINTSVLMVFLYVPVDVIELVIEFAVLNV